MEKVSIITVNFNQTEHTCALLESIRRQDYPDVEVIVVDNGSTENPAAFFQSRYPEIIFIRSEKNLGFAGGNNLALRVATGNFLFFVNNDAEVTSGSIVTLSTFLNAHPEVGMVSPLICYHPSVLSGQPVDAPLLIQYAGMPRVNRFTARSKMEGNGQYHQGQYSRPFPTGYAHGAAMMLSRKTLLHVGPMSEDYFLYYEEIDWCERIRQAGYAIWVVPEALVLHKESVTMKTLGALKTYYMSRNRVLFMRRHYGGWSYLVFIFFLFWFAIPRNVFQYCFKTDWKNLKAFLNGVFWNFNPKTA